MNFNDRVRCRKGKSDNGLRSQHCEHSRSTRDNGDFNIGLRNAGNANLGAGNTGDMDVGLFNHGSLDFGVELTGAPAVGFGPLSL